LRIDLNALGKYGPEAGFEMDTSFPGPRKGKKDEGGKRKEYVFIRRANVEGNCWQAEAPAYKL